MLKFKNSEDVAGLKARIEAIGRSQAMIEFELDGTILTANQNFLDAMGYSLEEIQGQHHGMFVEPAFRASAEYKAFWERLGRGEFEADIFKRVAKGGREIWIQAAYNPVLDGAGKPVRVVKVATDVTRQVLENANFRGQIEAIGKAQAVIEFDLDGTIITANENFLSAMGYDIDEIRGKHHGMFVTPQERESAEYRAFWQRLGQGQYDAGEYKRIAKGGREVWIQASYNPIRGLDGNPYKVVKFASDVTREKMDYANFAGQIEAIGKSQAVIEFELDGTIITANENFLAAMGYGLDEIRGQHHGMFATQELRESAEYREFWAKLARGEFQSGEFMRVAKGGREIWIQASYNPIRDLNGKPFKVVKFASDVTQQVMARKRAEHVGQLMEAVAAGSEQLNASVSEIASSMARSKDTTSGAFELVVGADQSTQELSNAANAMGNIVEVINSITGQINLLALNATIESARAGEAGKGFAVVANEVKTLASQAKDATQQISDSIDGMRAISGKVVGSLEQIRGSMEQVLEYVSSTASAVEEQSSVASQMSADMQKAAEEARAM